MSYAFDYVYDHGDCAITPRKYRQAQIRKIITLGHLVGEQVAIASHKLSKTHSDFIYSYILSG